MLEQDRGTFGRDEGASDMVAEAVRSHDRRPGRIPDVRGLEEEAGIHAVVAHRSLQTSEATVPEILELGIGQWVRASHVGHAATLSRPHLPSNRSRLAA